ncbi:DNA-binding domain-containing protein [Nostoc sp. 'Peltigera membranacea cyanobiont' 232]|uniref:DNA-binding domain-containing protein n=1 Tax=Nostoc sp. 'Peltigera membranacea cyanobiont' 232 TaxID=2014531 RepID=UPI001CB8FDC8|nr:DNA-binding domain-containing protein [Nostoc sp. 'Peltigera membranacea cyanobiont' 232]
MQLMKRLPVMVKPQIVVRLSPELLEKLNKYAEQAGASKTDVVVGALSQYLGCGEALPLNQKVAELEARVATVEALLKVS